MADSAKPTLDRQTRTFLLVVGAFLAMSFVLMFLTTRVDPNPTEDLLVLVALTTGCALALAPLIWYGGWQWRLSAGVLLFFPALFLITSLVASLLGLVKMMFGG